MTQTGPLTFNARQAAILDFEQTQCGDIARPNRRKAAMKSLAGGDYDKSIKQAEEAIDDVYRFELVKFIDIRIRAHVAEGRYSEALQAALEMRNRVPKDYYGYLREAQIHMVQENYAKAFKVYAKGIKTVTQRDQVSILKHSINDCLSILDRAASAYGHDRNFNEGQRIAKLMIKLLPTSPAGYLRSGTLFLMDGKETKAKKIYDKGIVSVPFTSRYSLINRKNHVLQRRLKPKDPFFFHAPWNVGSRIFQFLNAHDLVTCMAVSIRWRVLILEFREVWQELTIQGEFDVYAIQEAWRFVEKLRIQDSSSCVISTCLKLIMKGSFESLETLVIDSIDPPNNITCVKSFKLCDSIGLRIESVDKVMVVPLSGTSPQGMYRKKLKSCEENCNEKYEGHLRICPHMQSIATAPIPRVARAAIKCCPNLSELVMEKSWSNIFDKKTADNHSNTVINLKHLKIGRIDAIDDIYPFIKTYINNLQTLTLVNDNAARKDQLPFLPDWRRIPDITSNTLTKLVISSLDDDTEPKQWINYCPALEEVTLQDIKFLDETLFHALKLLPVLRRLELRSCSCTSILRFESFFDLLENKRNVAHLDTLVLHDFKNLENSSLYAISRYRNIRELVITNCPLVTGEGIENFSTRAGGNPHCQLETLVISGIKEVSDQTAIVVASNLLRLKQLTLDSLHDITDDAINTIATVARRTNLEILKVLRCKQITQTALNEAGRDVIVYYT